MTTIFMQRVDEYFEEYSGVYTTSTIRERRRQYVRMDRDVVAALLSDGMISSGDPTDWTVKDAKEIAVAIKAGTTYGRNYVARLEGSMNILCKFCLNQCFEHAKYRYPTLFPKKREERREPLSPDKFARIMEYCNREGQGFGDLRSSAIVTLSICGGLRPYEVRFVKASGMDLGRATVYVDVVKGGDSYGVKRHVPLHPDAEYILDRFMTEFRERGFKGYLFQYKGAPISGSAVRKHVDKVREGCGISFSLSDCRATWGQLLKDEGADLDTVSLLLGHKSTATTNKYYANMREAPAIENVRRIWAAGQNATFRQEEPASLKSDYIGEQEGIRTLGLQLRRLLPYPD